jgi:predicted ATPase
VTVVGTGGVGKTRLVVELGLGLASEWRDGVWFVDLSMVADATLVVGAVASAIGCPTSGNVDLRDAVIDWLRTRRALLILDNCEHLLDATARLTADILGTCPEVGVLATSRQPLGLGGEHLWRLDPLATSADDRDAPALDLFASRARLVQPEFRLDAQRTVVTAICARLDGLPLAIELAAPRLAVMTPAELLAGLDDRSRVLRSKDRNVADRQRTLDALLSWSHELLTSHEQAAFRRLAVFAGTFDLTTAAAAVADDARSAEDVPDLVWSLAEKSLIVVEPSANATRYRFLESVRAYALGCLADAAETVLSARRLTEWYLDRLGPWLPFNAALTGLRAIELDNLRALIGLVADADPARAQTLAIAVAQFHKRHGTIAAGVPETRRYLSNLPAPTPERVGLLCELAGLLVSAGEAFEAEELVRQAAALRGEVGAPRWDPAVCERMMALAKAVQGEQRVSCDIARCALAGDLDDRSRSSMLNSLAIAAAALADIETAYDATDQALELALRTADDEYALVHHNTLAELSFRRGAFAEAAHHQQAALESASQMGDLGTVAFSMILAARLAAVRDDWIGATQLHAKADVLLDQIGLVMFDDDRRLSDELRADASTHLGPETYTVEYRAGQGRSLADAIQLTTAALVEFAVELHS